MTKNIIKILIAIALIAALFLSVSTKDLVVVFSSLTLFSIAYLLFISVLLIYISALKWSYFLSALGATIPVIRLFNLYLVGYFVNLILPSYLGGDFVRSWKLGKRIGQHEALTATILERYTGLLAMVILAFIFMWFVSLVTFQMKCAVVVVAFGLAIITFVALSERMLLLVEKIGPIKNLTLHLRKIQAGFRLAKRDHWLLAKALLLSFMYHSFTILNTVAASWAVGWVDPPIGDLFVAVPIILLIAAIPATPSGLGIQEGAFFFFLKGLGATPAQALGVALVLRAKGYVLALVGGLIWLLDRKQIVASPAVDD